MRAGHYLETRPLDLSEEEPIEINLYQTGGQRDARHSRPRRPASDHCKAWRQAVANRLAIALSLASVSLVGAPNRKSWPCSK